MSHFTKSMISQLNVATAALVLLLAYPASQAQQSTLDELASDAESVYEALRLDVAVLFNGEVCSAFQTASEGTSSGRRYHAASISKLFTAIEIMRLRDQGLLSLNDSVGDYLPAFAGSEIQLQHLLIHTSGLRDRRRADGRNSAQQVNDYIESLAAQRVRNPPRGWRYADAGFNLLGKVIEQLSGNSFDQVMRDQLLTPLDMGGSDFLLARIPARNRLESFDKRGEDEQHPWDLAFMPSAGLQTTAFDLIKFSETILQIVENDDSSLLSRETLLEMTVNHGNTDFRGIGQGLGWQLATTELGPQWRHAGAENGFEGLLTIYPEAGLAITMLGNQEDWPRFELEQAIRQGFTSGTTSCSEV